MEPLRKRTFGRAQPQMPVAESASDAPALTAHDRRQHPRTRTSLQGKLSFGHASFAIDCLILDLGEGGARVRTQNGQKIPDKVILIRLRDRIAHEARVAWSNENGTVGLKFESTHDLDQSKTPGLKALRQYCVEYDLG